MLCRFVMFNADLRNVISEYTGIRLHIHKRQPVKGVRFFKKMFFIKDRKTRKKAVKWRPVTTHWRLFIEDPIKLSIIYAQQHMLRRTLWRDTLSDKYHAVYSLDKIEEYLSEVIDFESVYIKYENIRDQT